MRSKAVRDAGSTVSQGPSVAKLKAERVGFGARQRVPSPPATGPGKRCKLYHWGLGAKPQPQPPTVWIVFEHFCKSTMIVVLIFLPYFCVTPLGALRNSGTPIH